MSPRATWTGAQHSVLRALFGLWLAWRLALGLLDRDTNLFVVWRALSLQREDGVWAVYVVAGVALLAALAFAAGFRERWCALLLAAFGSEFGSLTLGGGWAVLALLAFALHPQGANAPYGSWDARGRVDPRGGPQANAGNDAGDRGGAWRRPPGLGAALLFLLASSYAIEGLLELGHSEWRDGSALALLHERGLLNPLLDALPRALWPLLATVMLFVRLAFLPVLLMPVLQRARPWIWTAALAVLLLSSLPTVLPQLFVFLLAFDPAWLKPRPAAQAESETIFYDGDCGLCHRAVRFVLAEDSLGRFAFAPLASEAFAAHGADAQALGDTMVLERADGTLAARSEAWVGILRGLGGGWRAVGELLRLVPRPLRDPVYDGVARVRKRLFARPDGACPLLPRDLAQRFRA